MTTALILPDGWRDAVPEVQIPRHPLWIDAYEGAWDVFERWAAHANATAAETAAITHYARYASAALPLHGWLDRQRETLPSPLHAWAEWALYQAEGDPARLTQVFPALRKQYFRQVATQQPGGGAGTESSASTARAEAVYYRPQASYDPEPLPWARIDLSAQQAMAAECMVKMSRAVGASNAGAFEANWQRLRAVIERGWNSSARFYLDEGSNAASAPVKTLAELWPLAAGIPSLERANQIAAHLSEPAEFWRVHVFPSLSADHPRYSDRGYLGRGDVDPFQNYAIVKGLERYGLHELARRAADNHLTTLSHVYKETRSHWDHYAPDYIEPAGDARHDAAGTGVSAIALLLETILGLHLDAPGRTLHWRPSLHETYRVAGLRIGSARVSLEVTPVAGSAGRLLARVRSSEPVHLHVSTPEGEQWADVENESSLSVGAWGTSR